MSEKRNNEGDTVNAAGGLGLVRTFLGLLSGNGKSNAMKVVGIIIAIAALLGIGFFTGRKTINPVTDTVTIYVPGDTVEIKVKVPVPVQVVKPADTANVILDCIKNGKYADLFPEKVRDSIIYVSKADTAAVLADWATERFYEEKVFDIDTVGTATIKAKTQYNRLTILGGTFVPIVKETTVTNVLTKKFEPFIGAGITTMPEVVVNGGMFFDSKYGVSVMYEYNWQINRHAVGMTALYKF